MRASIVTLGSKNGFSSVDSASWFNGKRRDGRVQMALIVGLMLTVTCSLTLIASLKAEDEPGSSSPADPVIEGFNVLYMETSPDEWEYTFSGQVVNGNTGSSFAIEIYGGPFSETTGTNTVGNFESIVYEFGDPPYGSTIYAVVVDGGVPVSEPVSISL